MMPKDIDQLATFAAEHIEVAAVRVALEGFRTNKASDFIPRRISVWPVAIHTARLMQWGSWLPSNSQRRDPDLQVAASTAPVISI